MFSSAEADFEKNYRNPKNQLNKKDQFRKNNHFLEILILRKKNLKESISLEIIPSGPKTKR